MAVYGTSPLEVTTKKAEQEFELLAAAAAAKARTAQDHHPEQARVPRKSKRARSRAPVTDAADDNVDEDTGSASGASCQGTAPDDSPSEHQKQQRQKQPCLPNALSRLQSSGHNEPKRKRARATRRRASHKGPHQKKKLTQMTLDCGQKGLEMEYCSTCNMAFVPGSEDVAQHARMHRKHSQGIAFTAENIPICKRVSDSEFIVVAARGTKSRYLTQKAKEIALVVNSQLGYSGDATGGHADEQTFMYIANKHIAGCVIVEPLERAFRVIPAGRGLADTDYEPSQSFDSVASSEDTGLAETVCRSEKQFPARLGVSRMWVHPSHRRAGIMTELIETARWVAKTTPPCAGQLKAHKLQTGQSGWKHPACMHTHIQTYTHTHSTTQHVCALSCGPRKICWRFDFVCPKVQFFRRGSSGQRHGGVLPTNPGWHALLCTLHRHHRIFGVRLTTPRRRS
eukprot:m.259623 g.259623  ORF g.259623 m.259623 type:complete len:454 (+) comp19205_c1_seq2:325-1686(+)